MDERRTREALDSLRKEGQKEEKMKRNKLLLFLGMILSSPIIFYGLYTLLNGHFDGLLYFALGGVQYFRCLEEISR